MYAVDIFLRFFAKLPRQRTARAVAARAQPRPAGKFNQAGTNSFGEPPQSTGRRPMLPIQMIGVIRGNKIRAGDTSAGADGLVRGAPASTPRAFLGSLQPLLWSRSIWK